MSSLRFVKNLLFTSIILIVSTCSAPTQSSKPQSRWQHQMAYDEENKQTLIYEGVDGDSVFNDLRALNETGWKQLSKTGPLKRIKAAFAYDANRKHAVLFGGSADGLMDDTWEWDGKEWKQNTIKDPSVRNHPRAVYDAKNKVILLFGGFGSTGLHSDTWR